MRNATLTWKWAQWMRAPRALAALVLIAAGAGCADNPSAKQQLNAGFRALDQKQYDQAIAVADAYLRKTPNGPGSAEARYLEGRVYEERAESAGAAGNGAGARANLEKAGGAYARGLGQPAAIPRVQALLHAGAANVAYYLDDYGAAVREWQLSYPQIEPAEARAWVLYRIGFCQQRLGWFAEADRSFAMVRQQFPGTVPATRAATHQGAKAFYVQVGAFADGANADRTVNGLRAQGLLAQKFSEPGRQVVRIGPEPSYAEARALKARLAAQYPGALVEP